MLLRFSLSAVGALLLAAGAQAQSNASYLPAPAAKNAGTYDLATGKMVKGTPVTKGLMEVLYANNCISSAWVYSNGVTKNGNPSAYNDAGVLPSTTSQEVLQDATVGAHQYYAVEFTGTDDSYVINQFQFLYCTDNLPRTDWVVSFYDCFVECGDLTTGAPPSVASFLFSNLPGTATPGSGACWIITTAPMTNTTFAFTMTADCDGTWTASPPIQGNTFGYQIALETQGSTTIWTSPGCVGDPDGIRANPGTTGCAIGVSTVFFEGSAKLGTASQGSGLGNNDRFSKADKVGGAVWTHNACYWFRNYDTGNPMGNLFMVMWGEATTSDEPPGIQIGGGGAGMPCPCANNNDGTLLPDLSGCATTNQPEGGRLLASGTASVVNDTVNLMADHLKNNTFGLFFKGNTPFLPGVIMGGANGNGLLQCAGKIKRFPAVQANTLGYVDSHGGAVPNYPNPLSQMSGAAAGNTRVYQFWYRTPKKNGPCTNPSPGGSNTTNTYRIIWGA
jgi:hypothetical protein